MCVCVCGGVSVCVHRWVAKESIFGRRQICLEDLPLSIYFGAKTSQ